MQIFPRSAIASHAAGAEWPKFLGAVQLGESFTIETERFKPVNGPIRLACVSAGEAIAVHIERIEMVGPFEAMTGEEGGEPEPVELEYEEGCFYFPRHFRIKARPTVGNIGVLPAPTEAVRALARRAPDLGWRAVMNSPRGKHCHQDCPWLAEGAVLHLRAQVDGAGLCVSDAHGYQAAGSLAYAGIEVSANIQLRAERSQGWLVDWPLIETEDEIMVLVSRASAVEGGRAPRYADIAREAYGALRDVVARRLGIAAQQADPLVATAIEVRNCALLGLEAAEGAPAESPWDVSVVAVLPKESLHTRRRAR